MPSPSLSPRVQSFSAPAPSNDQAKTLFEQGLSQMAYNVLLSKLPNVAPDVVTFKILDSDPEAGNGVGSFVVSRAGLTFYIPVVMAENQVKPLDLLFYKDMNVFLPLSKEWLEQLGKQQVGELGQGVKPPTTLTTDVDIRNTVVPPTTGRYSYAAEQSALAPFESLTVPTPEPKLAFLDFLSKAPNRVKKAAAEMFETRPKLLKLAAQFYGKKALVDALSFSQEKVADYGGKIKSTGGALYIADKSTASGEFKNIFGADAGIAYQGVLRRGYHAKDTRTELNSAVKVEAQRKYEEPKGSGAFTIHLSDGKPVNALIIGNPTDLTNPRANRVPARNLRFVNQSESPANPTEGAGVNYRMPGLSGKDPEVFINHFVGVTEDGKLIDVPKLIGSPVEMSELEGSSVFKKTVGESSAEGPRVGQIGFFAMRKGASFVGTRPVKVESVTTDSAGTKLVRVIGSRGMRTLAINKEHANGMLLVPAEGIVHVPANYAWIATSGELEASEIMTNPKDVLRWGLQNITKTAAERVVVKKAYHGYTFGDVSREGFEFVPALRKLATESRISVEDAEHALKMAEEFGRFEFYAVTPSDMQKLSVHAEAEGTVRTLGREFDVSAGVDVKKKKKKDDVNLDSFHKLNPEAEPKGKKKHAAEDPMAAKKPKAEKKPEQDPAADAMAQVEAAQMAMQPQGPSPVDMAVAEQLQNIQGQMTALQQMMQMVQTIQQRANMIAGGGGAAAAPAAAAAAMGGPMDPSMMGAGAPVQNMPGAPADPMQGQQPPADPMGAPGGAPPAGGAMGAPPPTAGMPSQMGGMPPQQGQDPNAPPAEAPPQAMMAADDGDLNSMAQQVNPQFMEQAGQLNDAGAFDAAALSTMAQSPVLRDLVQAYLPNLEKSLDNIGRVLLTLWMDESHVKEDIGVDTFVGLEENLRTVFKGLGELILKVNQNALVLRDKNESIFQG